MMNETSGDGREPNTVALVCIECESTINPTSNSHTTRAGAAVCLECVAAYYVACAGCEQFIPQDETRTRADLVLCAECYARPPNVAGAGSPDQSGIESLIAEYTALHAEEKRMGARMEEIKELLKELAATQPRVSGAVTLRAGDQAVKCSFRTTLKCDAEAIGKLEQTLDRNEFGELFERKVTYTPRKEPVQDFLRSTDDAHNEAREMLRAAVRETESATLTVVPKK
ncbi:MAG: hypothetical protein H0T92_10830 [Pyrinomonadaceae bacterium]|nr:hypothetical protein [Pyrinomonadaceae bacterium]